jgi:hypothetical protein
MFKIDAPEVKAVIDKHKRTGHIVDFYSEEHVANLDIDSAPITIGDLKEYDRKYGADYRGHLLTVYLGDHQQELFNDLCHCYPSFKQILTLKNQYGGAMHKPALLIINVKTREILCAGLGKKMFFFLMNSIAISKTGRHVTRKISFLENLLVTNQLNALRPFLT